MSYYKPSKYTYPQNAHYLSSLDKFDISITKDNHISYKYTLHNSSLMRKQSGFKKLVKWKWYEIRNFINKFG